MKTLKVIHNNKTNFIVNIALKFQDKFYLEIFNADIYKDRGKVYSTQEDYGTKNFPLLVFEDENLEGFSAIWSEQNPDWEKEINNVLKNV